MNETQFEMNLRTAMVAGPSPSTLNSQIDAEIDRLSNRRRVKRRLVVSLVATAAVATGIFLFPAMKAQASVGQIANALDRKMSAKASSYMIDENGKEWYSSTTTIAHGDMSTVGGENFRNVYEIGNDSFVYDPSTKSYIRSPRRPNEGLKLSQLLGPASIFSVNKRVSLDRVTEGGKTLIRAIVVNGDLPERYVIIAEPDTDLPLRIQIESREQGNWRLRQIVRFQYEDGLSVTPPDFKKNPAVSKEENDARMNAAATSTVIGEITRKNEKLIVRRVDVADDGTIFVCFQSGNPRVNSWSGYRLWVEDNLHTKYFRGGQMFPTGDDRDPVPAGGALEMEIFIPEKPVARDVRRTLSLSTFVNEQGELDKIIGGEEVFRGKTKVNVRFPDGHTGLKEYPRFGGKPHVVSIATFEVSRATCSIKPEWSSRYFLDDVQASIRLSEMKANHAMEAEAWSDADRYLNEELRWMRESQRQGMSWAQENVKRNLETVQKHLNP